jgi:two-component system, chemotaxis family, chemotaxis protein CheY
MSNGQNVLGAMRVLVIDDHKGMRDIISAILSGLGIGQIVLVADPDAALQEILRAPPDIIFLDWVLAGEDGLRFVRLIRRLPDQLNPSAPVIMMTGHADREQVMMARDAGVSEFLVKPVSVIGVAERLEALIQNPRPFVRAERFVGPDRRRRAEPVEGGDRRGLFVAGTAAAEGLYDE